MQNLTWKLQFNGFLFSRRVVSSCSWWHSRHCLGLVLWTFYVFNVLNLFISRASHTVLLYMFDIMVIVLGWIQLNCRWHSFGCSVAPDDSQLPFMLSFWCSMQRYLPCMNNSTSGWLLGSSFGLFWHRILCKFLPTLKKKLKENPVDI